MNIHEIKDNFLFGSNSEDQTKELLKSNGLCGGLSNEMLTEWVKLKAKDLTSYPKGILEKEKYIALFMGASYYPKVAWWKIFTKWSDAIVYPNSSMFGLGPKALKYSTSWDWLIPVCSKALDICMAQERPSPNHCSYFDWIEQEIATSLREYNKEVTFEFAIDFIFYYNQTKLTHGI